MISVVVPFYNARDYIQTCAESLCQPGEFEYLFVDDYSTDKGSELLEPFLTSDERFKLLQNEHSKGVSGARNTGIDHAQGELVTFLDVDDIWLDNAYLNLMHTVSHCPRANVYQLNHKRFYAYSGRTKHMFINNRGNYSSKCMPQCWFGVWNKLIRRDFLTMRFDESLQYGEDALFVLECLAKEDWIFCAPRELLIVEHRFINPYSLCKSKDAQDLLRYIHALEQFLLRCESRSVRNITCAFISELWVSKPFTKTFAK